MKPIHYVSLIVALGLTVGLFSCAELKDELPAPVAPGVQAHGPGWVDSTSADFHGKAIAAAGGDYSSCLQCHGYDFDGGVSSVSCVTCHQNSNASLHGRGWTDPAAANFHGNAIRSQGWDMRPCKSCHGETYDGGRVSVGCRDCHSEGAGPENCATCHGGTNPAPPRDLSKNTVRTARGVGAHQIHLLGGNLFAGTRCTGCHVVPGSVYTAGHVDTPQPVEVTMAGNLVANTVTNEPTTMFYSPSLPLYTPDPVYNGGQINCSNSYCHGNFKNGNPGTAPVWNEITTPQAACGSCHGDVTKPTLAERALPKTVAEGGTHPNATTCSACHIGVVNANLVIIDKFKHVNGRLNVFEMEIDF